MPPLYKYFLILCNDRGVMVANGEGQKTAMMMISGPTEYITTIHYYKGVSLLEELSKKFNVLKG